MKIEIGKYYLNDIKDLLYVFGSGGMELAGSLEYPDGVNEEDVEAMLGIRVLPLISRTSFLQFQQSVETKTVFKLNRVPTYPNYGNWVETDPDEDIRLRFEKSFFTMGLVNEFTKHMINVYGEKYKDDKICARDILK